MRGKIDVTGRASKKFMCKMGETSHRMARKKVRARDPTIATASQDFPDKPTRHRIAPQCDDRVDHLSSCTHVSSRRSKT
jgi:hypothetical protein